MLTTILAWQLGLNSPKMLFLAWSHWINHLLKGACFDLFQSSISMRSQTPFFSPKGEVENQTLNIDLTEKKCKSLICQTYTASKCASVHVHYANNLFETRQVLVANRASPLPCYTIHLRGSYKQETLSCVDSGRRALYTTVELQCFTLAHMFRPPLKQMDTSSKRAQMTPISYNHSSADCSWLAALINLDVNPYVNTP